MVFLHTAIKINVVFTYLIATGSDETISRIFSQPNVQMYEMTYNSCQDGVFSILTRTT